MPKASITTQDKAGGIINPGLNDFVRVNGKLVAIEGDTVQSHGSGPHSAATIIKGSSHVRINGIPVCVEGSDASCGHKATGSEHVSYEI